MALRYNCHNQPISALHSYMIPYQQYSMYLSSLQEIKDPKPQCPRDCLSYLTRLHMSNTAAPKKDFQNLVRNQTKQQTNKK